MRNRSSHPYARLCAALLVVGLTACGADSGGSTAAPPTTGGALTYATPVEPDCLDPAVSARDVTALFDRNIFDSLVQQKPDGSSSRGWPIGGRRRPTGAPTPSTCVPGCASTTAPRSTPVR